MMMVTMRLRTNTSLLPIYILTFHPVTAYLLSYLLDPLHLRDGFLSLYFISIFHSFSFSYFKILYTYNNNARC